MTIEAMKAIQMVYANTTKHDWPDDIWDAICQAVESEVTDLDAICQDLQEKTYTQAMRIAELEAKREWVDLTEDEWLLLGYKSIEEVRIGLAIQSKLKKKNT